MVVVSSWCEYIGGTHGSGIVSSTDDVLEKSVVHWVRGVGGVCNMSMCLARSGMGKLGLGFNNHVGIEGV